MDFIEESSTSLLTTSGKNHCFNEFKQRRIELLDLKAQLDASQEIIPENEILSVQKSIEFADEFLIILADQDSFVSNQQREYEALISKIWAFFGGSGVLNIPSSEHDTSDQNVVMETHSHQPEPDLLENLAEPTSCISLPTIRNEQDQIDGSQNIQELTVNAQSINQVSQSALSFNQPGTNLSKPLPRFIADAFVYDPFIKFTAIENPAPMDLILQKAQMLPNQRSYYGMSLFSSRLSFSSGQIAFKERLSQSYRLTFSSVGFVRYVSSNEKPKVVDRPHHIASSFMTENSEMYARLLFRRHKLQFRITNFDQLLQKCVSCSNPKPLRSQ